MYGAGDGGRGGGVSDGGRADKLVVNVALLVDAKGDLMVLDNMGISLQVNTCFYAKQKYVVGTGGGVSGGGGGGELMVSVYGPDDGHQGRPTTWSWTTWASVCR